MSINFLNSTHSFLQKPKNVQIYLTLPKNTSYDSSTQNQYNFNSETFVQFIADVYEISLEEAQEMLQKD